jgi:hypothetical protein
LTDLLNIKWVFLLGGVGCIAGSVSFILNAHKKNGPAL